LNQEIARLNEQIEELQKLKREISLLKNEIEDFKERNKSVLYAIQYWRSSLEEEEKKIKSSPKQIVS